MDKKILEYLAERADLGFTHPRLNTQELAKEFGEDHQKIVGAVNSIKAHGDGIIVDYGRSESKFVLTEEGKEIILNGSHEARFYRSLPNFGLSLNEVMKLPSAKHGYGKAKSNGWVFVDEDNTVQRAPDVIIVDTVAADLKQIDEGSHEDIPMKVMKMYKARKYVKEIIVKSFDLTKGPKFTTNLVRLEADLTADMLASGSWQHLKFKEYNFDALGVPLTTGCLHPLLKVRTEFRQIFLEMGFTEMPTNNYIESSFWNFDALFQPQQHPARDAHDTFFIKDPQFSSQFPADYLYRVATVHSKGSYGSDGYGYKWSQEEAKKNLLRTHTTAVSARMLYKLGQEKQFRPVKWFSIDKVFRNETLDATHLAEFHQVEGVIADHNLTLGDLIGIISEFFKKLGITELEFKPAYNPYTEPSMEIFCFHPGLKKWIELGNSGLFRPEMLLPMGLPDNVRVIAWGLSLERPTMIKYGFNNIRDLIGPKVDLEMVQKSPICRLNT